MTFRISDSDKHVLSQLENLMITDQKLVEKNLIRHMQSVLEKWKFVF